MVRPLEPLQLSTVSDLFGDDGEASKQTRLNLTRDIEQQETTRLVQIETSL